MKQKVFILFMSLLVISVLNIQNTNAGDNPNKTVDTYPNNQYLSATYLPKKISDYLTEPNNALQRNITVWATGLRNNGRQKRIYRLERRVRYKVRVSRFTHFGTWRPTRRALKNDACYEFNARRRPVSLPVIRTNFGFNFCRGTYKANHIYESQVLYGNGTNLVMWVYDTDYRDNYGSYYIEVIQIRSRR